jgi:hypothetical protein
MQTHAVLAVLGNELALQVTQLKESNENTWFGAVQTQRILRRLG